MPKLIDAFVIYAPEFFEYEIGLTFGAAAPTLCRLSKGDAALVAELLTTLGLDEKETVKLDSGELLTLARIERGYRLNVSVPKEKKKSITVIQTNVSAEEASGLSSHLWELIGAVDSEIELLKEPEEDAVERRHFDARIDRLERMLASLSNRRPRESVLSQSK